MADTNFWTNRRGRKSAGAGTIKFMRKLNRIWLGLVVACAIAGLSVSLFAQIDPRTALLERAGWDALTSGRAPAAAEASEGSLGLGRCPVSGDYA